MESTGKPKVLVELDDARRFPCVYMTIRDRGSIELTMLEAEDLADRLTEIVETSYPAKVAS